MFKSLDKVLINYCLASSLIFSKAKSRVSVYQSIVYWSGQSASWERRQSKCNTNFETSINNHKISNQTKR